MNTMNEMSEVARESLLNRRAAIVKLYAKHTAALKQVEENVERDWVDRAADVETESLLGRLTDEERREVEEIDAALGRIARQSFGQCESCGVQIGRQRLRAVPEARYCLTCAEERA